MLNYIVDMVTKTKRSLFILQQKDYNQRKFIERNDLEWRRRHADLISQTDGRIVELRRKTGMKKSDFHLNMIIISFHFSEETVLEIKRQSIIDLQQAVTQTEQKSNDLLLCEREQYQRLKAQTFEDVYKLFNRQEDGPEVILWGICTFINIEVEFFYFLSNVGIVAEKQLKHVRAVVVHVIVDNIVNIVIGNYIRRSVDLI